jgi:hypothetical protein
MWIRTPIWEPENTRFRPYSIGTLIGFFVGRLMGGFLGKLRSSK